MKTTLTLICVVGAFVCLKCASAQETKRSTTSEARHMLAKAGMPVAERAVADDKSKPELVFVQPSGLSVDDKRQVTINSWAYAFQSSKESTLTAVTVSRDGTAKTEKIDSDARFEPIENGWSVDIDDLVKAMNKMNPPQSVAWGAFGIGNGMLRLGMWRIAAKDSNRTKLSWAVSLVDVDRAAEVDAKPSLALFDAKSGTFELAPPNSKVEQGSRTASKDARTESSSPSQVPKNGVKKASFDNPPAAWPKYSGELVGRMEVRVKNPNDFKVRVGLRSDVNGKDFTVAANDTESVRVPNGRYEIYFQYSTDPDGLYQGDSFTLNDNGVEIQIVKVVNGNYGIRKVK